MKRLNDKKENIKGKEIVKEFLGFLGKILEKLIKKGYIDAAFKFFGFGLLIFFAFFKCPEGDFKFTICAFFLFLYVGISYNKHPTKKRKRKIKKKK